MLNAETATLKAMTCHHTEPQLICASGLRRPSSVGSRLLCGIYPCKIAAVALTSGIATTLTWLCKFLLSLLPRRLSFQVKNGKIKFHGRGRQLPVTVLSRHLAHGNMWQCPSPSHSKQVLNFSWKAGLRETWDRNASLAVLTGREHGFGCSFFRKW